MKKAAKNTPPDLPRYLVQETEKGLFRFCIEINGAFQCWTSAHPPSMDIRFKRKITRTSNLPLTAFDQNKKGVNIWGKGTYSIAKFKTKKEIEKAFLQGLSKNRLSFQLTGGRLNGRFIIHYNDDVNRLFLYKQKDKFATEEDPLEMELQRSVNKWVPEYDPDKAKEPEVNKKKASQPADKKESGRAKKKANPVKEKKVGTPNDKRPKNQRRERQKKISEGAFTDEIKAKTYRFSMYRSFDNEKDLICLVTPLGGDSFVMKATGKSNWEIVSTVGIDIARNENLFKRAILEFLQ